MHSTQAEPNWQPLAISMMHRNKPIMPSSRDQALCITSTPVLKGVFRTSTSNDVLHTDSWVKKNTHVIFFAIVDHRTPKRPRKLGETTINLPPELIPD